VQNLSRSTAGRRSRRGKLRNRIVRRGTAPDELLVAAELGVEGAPDHALESRALLALASAIAQSPNALAQCLVEAALAAGGAESAGLAGREPGSGRLETLALVGPAAADQELSEQCRTLCERALETGAPQLFARADPGDRLLALPAGLDPVRPTVLWVAASPSARGFEAEDARLLGSLCSLAASTGRALRLAAPEAGEPHSYALEAAGMIGWEWDLARDEIRRSAGLQRLIGPGREFGSREEFLSLVHPEDSAVVQEALRAALHGEGAYFAEFRLNRGDGGEPIWVADQGRVEFGADGRPAFIRGVVRDITVRRRAQEAVRRQAGELQAIMDSVPAVVFLAHDPECRRITGSRRAYEVLRLPFGSNISMTAPLSERPTHFRVFHNGRQLSPHELPLQTAARGIEVRDFEELVAFTDGGSVRLFGNANPIRDASGRLRGAVATFVDISDRIQAEQALIEAKEAAEEANRAKSRFLAAASHDLRQPLQALHLYMGLLGERLGGREEELQNSIQRCLRGLTRLLDDLLDISKLDAGLIQAVMEPVALDELIDWVANDFRLQAAERGLQLDVVRCPRATGLSDPTLLGRILSNIVANAVRYTDDGRILVGCRRRGDRYRIEVWDTGIGIPTDKITEIFREFHQLDNEGRNSERGTGLGLAIVERLARLLQHRVEVRSWPGRGSMFAIELPATERPAEEPRAARTAAASGPCGLVAVLEDETMVREALAIVLEGWGYEVAAAGTPALLEQCLAERRRPPDLVIADYRLGAGQTGPSAIAALRRKLGPSLPAIVLTGDTSPERIREMAESGFHLLHKPLDIDKLREAVQFAGTPPVRF
jgi:PAS domain S-box-containing protein